MSFRFPAVCLNLDRRYARRQALTDMFARNGINLSFFLAGDRRLPVPYDHVDVVPPQGRSGYRPWVERPNSYNAFLCYQKILRAQAKFPVLLVEDDVVLADNFMDGLALALSGLPADFGLLYLGANHTHARTAVAAPGLLKVDGSLCFHCVLVSLPAARELLRLPMDGPIDGMATRLHRSMNCYACWPPIALTEPGYSHCEGAAVDYNHLFTNRGTECESL